MKKIWLLLVMICLVLVAGTAFGDEFTTKTNDWASNPDSLINVLDPSNAPAPIVPAHRGLLGLTEEGLPGAGGSAAGGRSETRDSLVNYLDPSNAPAEKIPKRSTTEFMRDNPDSLIYQISPSL